MALFVNARTVWADRLEPTCQPKPSEYFRTGVCSSLVRNPGEVMEDISEQTSGLMMCRHHPKSREVVVLRVAQTAEVAAGDASVEAQRGVA